MAALPKYREESRKQYEGARTGLSQVLHGFALLLCWRMMAEPNTVIIDAACLKDLNSSVSIVSCGST